MFNIISRILRAGDEEHKIVRLPANRGPHRGCVSILYIAWPFKEGYESAKARGHTNAFEVVAMAEAYRNLGCRVEVTSSRNAHYQAPKDCIAMVDIHGNLERFRDLSPQIPRVLHATGSHWVLWNLSEYHRLEEVKKRKGVSLVPRRQVRPSTSAESSTEIVVLGNEYTGGSFGFAGKPTTRIPISSAYSFEWPEDRNVEQAKKRFLWVGSYGMVHKGLDLVLDAFSKMPELELTVCGRPEKEADFFRLYEKELRHTTNIHFHGWLDMASPDFTNIARTHAGIIYPSCAEGGAGSVIHCMHAGMVPLCTEESSVDLCDFGVAIRSGDVESVKNAAEHLSSLSDSEVNGRARASYEHARRHHTRELFAVNYANYAGRILSA